MTTAEDLSAERAALLDTLRAHRGFLKFAVQNLTDEQARAQSTVSELTLGGLIKHVAGTEKQWADFIVGGTQALSGPKPWTEWGPEEWQARADDFRLLEDETLADALARYDDIAARTDDLVATLPDLDITHPLPDAPWFPPNATRSARRAFLHIIAETAQHAGHADILREAIDGQKTMG